MQTGNGMQACVYACLVHSACACWFHLLNLTMRLTIILSSFRREFIGNIPKYPGNVLTGKHRFVPPVTMRKKIKFLKERLVEEEAIRALSTPYVDRESEERYLRMHGREHQTLWDDFMRRPLETPLKQSYAADYIEKLDVCRSFEPEN